MAMSLLIVDVVSDRIILSEAQADPVDLVVYMPTFAHDDDEVKEMYKRIDELVVKRWERLNGDHGGMDCWGSSNWQQALVR